jgi:hypothetical protein
MFTAPPWWLFRRECKLSLRHIPQPLPTKPTVHGVVPYLLKTWGSIECAYIVHLLYVRTECTLLYRAARSGKAVYHIHGGFVWYIPVCIKPHCDELLSTKQTRHGPRIHDPNIVVFHGIFCRCQPHMSVEEREKKKQWDDATSGDMRRPSASALCGWLAWSRLFFSCLRTKTRSIVEQTATSELHRSLSNNGNTTVRKDTVELFALFPSTFYCVRYSSMYCNA